MSNSYLVALRVPTDLLERLDSKVSERLATDRKANRSQVILDALEAYLSQTLSNTDTQSQTLSNTDLRSQILEVIEPLRLEMEKLRGKLPA